MKKAKSTIEGGEQWSCASNFLVQPHNRRSDIQITCSRKHTQKSVDNIRHEAHTPVCAPYTTGLCCELSHLRRFSSTVCFSDGEKSQSMKRDVISRMATSEGWSISGA